MADKLGVELLLNLIAGHIDPDTIAWLRRGAATTLRSGGDVSLDRALRLPTTPAAWRRFQRDHHLHAAADALQETDDLPNLAKALTLAWHAFVTRGPWLVWRDAGGPPVNASRLREALFHASRANGGRVLCEKHVKSIISRGNLSHPKFPPTHATVNSVAMDFEDPRMQTDLNGLAVDDEVLAREARREWDASADLRTEFGGKFDRYLAYRKADARGLVGIIPNPMGY